jgi:ferric iron reductase protein FhuF
LAGLVRLFPHARFSDALPVPPAGAGRRPVVPPQVIPLLAPVFQGELAAYGETLACDAQPPGDAVSVARLLDDPAVLADALQRHARHRGCRDLRPVASAWSFNYLEALLPPVMAAASVLQHVLPVLPQQMWVRLDGDGEARSFHIRDEGRPQPGSSTAARYDALLWGHLQPLVEALVRATRVPAKVLWGNVARYVEAVLDQAMPLTGHAPHVVQDREQLLQHAHWPDGRGNPLHGCYETLPPGDAAAAPPYRQCCLLYLLPGDDGYCHACPLSPPHRGLRSRLRAAARTAG